jgi:hypothetical protein
VAQSDALTFAGTAGEQQTINITINGDTTIEANETFTATLGTVGGTSPTQAAAISTGATATGTITNDDTETLTIASPSVTEGNSGTETLIFMVTYRDLAAVVRLGYVTEKRRTKICGLLSNC